MDGSANDSYNWTISKECNDDALKYTYWGTIFLIIFSWIFFIVGIIMKDDTLTIIGGILLLIMGIYTLSSGILGIDNWVTQWFSIINMLIGIYILILWTYRQYENL